MNGKGKYSNSSPWVSNKEAREILDISPSTLRAYTLSNKIVTVRTDTGRYKYNRKSLYEFMGINIDEMPKKKKSVCYARVSSLKQKDDLERQKEFFRTKYPGYEVVCDIGSGINWKRKGLQTILEQSMQGIVEEVVETPKVFNYFFFQKKVVAHRDRLCRFGFELVEFILTKCGVKLMVLGEENGKSESEELAEDIMSIIHVYSCKQMGKRRYRNNRNQTDKVTSDKKTKVNVK